MSFTNGAMVFDYPAKSGQRRVHQVHDPRCTQLVRTLKRRRGGGDDLLSEDDDFGALRQIAA